MRTAGIDHLGRTVSTLKRTLVKLDVWLLQSIPSLFLFDVWCLNSRLVSEFRALRLNYKPYVWIQGLRLYSEPYDWILGLRLNSKPYVWIRSLCLNSSMDGNVFHRRAKSADQCWLGQSADYCWTQEHLMLGFWAWSNHSEFRWNKLCKLFQNINNCLVQCDANFHRWFAVW